MLSLRTLETDIVSINLMDLIQRTIRNQMWSLGEILGEDDQTTGSVVNAALQAILGGLMKKASTNDGASEIFKSLEDHDGGILDDLDDLLGSGQHTGLMGQGSGILGMLFGSDRSSVLGAISKMCSIEDSRVGTTLYLLAPIVMGVLGKQQRSRDLDLAGVSELLMSQKDHLSGQFPRALSDALSLGDMLEANSVAAKDPSAETQSEGQATGDVGDDSAATTDKPDAGIVGIKLLTTVLPVIILTGLAFFAFKHFTKQPEDTAVEIVETSEVAAPKIDLPGFDTAAIKATFGGLTDAVGGIKDVESARLVLPKIAEAKAVFDHLDLGAIADGPQKHAVGNLLGDLVRELRTVLDRVYIIPGIREVIDPVLRPFLDRFSVFGL